MVVAPPGASGATLLLARAATPEQEAFVGNQAEDLYGNRWDLVELAPDHPLAER